MRDYAKRQLEREQRRAREDEIWRSARIRFRQGLERSGVQLQPLFFEATATSPISDGEWLTWWRRSEISQRLPQVLTGIANRSLREIQFNGGRIARPGEGHTARLWWQARIAGSEVLDAAFLLTALRVTNAGDHHIYPDAPYWSGKAAFRDQLYRCSWDTLKSAQVDPYTLSRVHFLPDELNIAPGAEDADDCIDRLSAALATFLVEWTPVCITVEVAPEDAEEA